jgi:hypothetical protein
MVVNGGTLRALMPRWAWRWCAPALLLLVVLMTQPADCTASHHQWTGSSATAPVSAGPDHGPICHESTAGDLLWTQSRPAFAPSAKGTSEPDAVVPAPTGQPTPGFLAAVRTLGPAPSGRAILLSIGVARS